MTYDLVEVFHHYFDVKIAYLPAELENIFKLRYDVFCQEFKFEKEEDCPNQLETDHFDSHSIEAYLLHQGDHEVTGCVRLIMPKDNGLKLPFEHYTQPEFLPEKVRYAEVSRLTVAKNFRRRKWDGDIPTGVTSNVSQLGKIGRNFPLPAISMMFCGAALGRLHLLDYVYAMMEPRLAFAMSHYGIFFEQVGHLVEYHGERAAYRIDPMSIWQTVNPELKPLLNFIYFKTSQQVHQPKDSDHKKLG